MGMRRVGIDHVNCMSWCQGNASLMPSPVFLQAIWIGCKTWALHLRAKNRAAEVLSVLFLCMSA